VFFLPFATGSRLSVCTLRRTALAAQSRKNGHIVLSLAQRFRAAVGSPSRDHNKPLTRISHYAWTLLGVGGRAALHRLRKTLWRLALVLSAPPRRSARHPSSSEEGSVFNNSPPDSGGVAPWAPGWLYTGDSLSAACKAPPFQSRGEKSGLVPPQKVHPLKTTHQWTFRPN
jgi:hypothetical protein